ncbi:MAG: hypothetical protein QHD01_09865 [Bradyrhizobium sp.]|uniref:hypothetical protein n=1 Tax=Bradyrhizobium sp. TaxID=376 RepID=UPI0029AF0CE7|nr:hypothetical protein [Bradyrhizobium sp.]MDX3966890.1 hypothetical protein [Bradyrhizobium sp.]
MNKCTKIFAGALVLSAITFNGSLSSACARIWDASRSVSVPAIPTVITVAGYVPTISDYVGDAVRNDILPSGHEPQIPQQNIMNFGLRPS